MTPSPKLTDAVQFIKGVGPRRAELLANALRIHTIGDLLTHFPLRYERLTPLQPIRDVQLDTIAVVRGAVTKITNRRTRSRLMTGATVVDSSGSLQAVWFNYPGIRRQLTVGQWVELRGKVRFYQGLQLINPTLTVLAAEVRSTPEAPPSPPDGAAPPLLPVYPAAEPVPQRYLRQVIERAMTTHAGAFVDPFPEPYRRQRKLMELGEAMRAVHQPASIAEAEAARRRLKYDELYRLQVGVQMRASRVIRTPKPFPIECPPPVHARILKRFPFALTGAQQRVIDELQQDLAAPRPMNRLLQGDVGSGKTAIALYAILAAVAARRQAALLAPTEILAEQHALQFERLLAGSRVRFALLTGSTRAAERKEILAGLRGGTLDFVIGTHALMEPGVVFRDLQVIVIDEQHKFGVVQRADLRKKAPAADLLVMTATPIPRTLAMTVYGDLDVSVLDEMPPGRQAIRTRWVQPGQEAGMDAFIRERLREGRQAYFVYPLIEESERVQLKAATRMAEELRARRFPEFSVGLLHGGMSAEEKRDVMRKFNDGKLRILASTPVIEVGIDVGNATVIVIEDAQRFGLSQLHQLRGRVGRGKHLSHAFLVSEATTPEAVERLRTLERTTDGFQIADADLRLRGPGEYFGTRQSGMPELKLANLVDDYPLVKLAAQDARRLVEKDPEFRGEEFALLKRQLREYYRDRMEFSRSG